MDIVIEANRNSALFNTMQEALEVYNPLENKSRPTTVNQVKHRLNLSPISWGNTMAPWNGRRTATFTMPRIGHLIDSSLKVAFRIPGEIVDSSDSRTTGGYRGKANTALKLGTITDNTDSLTNNARGRLDRVYADRLLGFQMVQSYTVSSKSREIFRGDSEYLMLRFSQLDANAKKAISDSCTPRNVNDNVNENFYSPGMSYQMSIPLWFFFNERIDENLDVNFAEDVTITVNLKAPSELFWYGNIGDLTFVPNLLPGLTGEELHQYENQDKSQNGKIPWDQSSTIGAMNYDQTRGVNDKWQSVYNIQTRYGQTNTVTPSTNFGFFGTVNLGNKTDNIDDDLKQEGIVNPQINPNVSQQASHIAGRLPPSTSTSYRQPIGATNKWLDPVLAGGNPAMVSGSCTFSYPDVDSMGKSVDVQLQIVADYLIQDTDSARALKEARYPPGTGYTTIVFNTAHEIFSNLMSSSDPSRNLLDIGSGGNFADPSQSQAGLTTGDSTRYVDLQIRNNNLAFATHFMVRKMSDMQSSRNSNPSITKQNYGQFILPENKTLGAHRIYSRALPVHYFELIVAGRTIFESDGESQMNITQSQMYPGTGIDYSVSSDGEDAHMPFYIYSINFGLTASRLENTGCNSYQNENIPTLRIYFKPEKWAEHSPLDVEGHENNEFSSEAKLAASMGVQVDMIHEFYNVVTISSGNGEITSGLNQ